MEEDDYKRLSPKFKRKVQRPTLFDVMALTIDGSRVMFGALRTCALGKFNACVALEGEVGKKVHCAIYDERPKICHIAVVKGDKSCRTLRKWYKDYLR